MPRASRFPIPATVGSVGSMPAAPRLLAAWLLGALGLGLFVRSWWPEAPLAERAGFAAALETAGRLAPARFVLVSPPQQAAALERLPASWTAGDALPQEPADARSWPELVVLSPEGAATPVGLEAATLVEHTTQGGVSVRLFRFPGGERVLYDLARALGTVHVRLEGDPPLDCDRPLTGGGHGCPGQPEWNTVEPRVLTVGGRAWSCVWAHPRTGRPLVLELGAVPLGVRLELEAALADGAVGGGAPVRLRLEVEGLTSRELVRSDAIGITRLVVPTTAGETRGVRLTITTPSDGRRHLGLRLRALSPLAKGGQP
jgi:hypothetical protein